MNGLEGNDVLSGQGGNDDIEGGLGIDVLFGGNGDDFLEGNKGTDFMFGENGNDIMEWDDGDGSDIMDGGSGYDTAKVDGSVKQGDEFVLQQSSQKGETKAIFDRLNLVPFNLTVENTEVFDVNGEGGDDSFIVGDLSQTAVKKVIFSGGDGNDTLDAPETATQIEADGGKGNDFLASGSGDDTLEGGHGDDFLQGRKGTDIMRGGAGNDVMVWANGDGSDIMSGGSGFDVAGVRGSVRQGDEFVLQQRGNKAIFDRVNLVPFRLTVDTTEAFAIQGEGGNDSLKIGNLAKTDVQLVQFSGGDGNDLLNGSDTHTTINATGDGGHDVLIGGSADDMLDGGSGKDIISGGGGDDLLTGGLQADAFVFSSGRAFRAKDFGVDTITDFNAAQGDRIILDAATFGNITAADIAIVESDRAALRSSGLITYSQKTGNLFFNENGAAAGLGKGAQIATLEGSGVLARDISIVSEFAL
ncbi:MAG: calcium-binding protein, partial [Phormidesmis sp.]